jgi:hypothetical protein
MEWAEAEEMVAAGRSKEALPAPKTQLPGLQLCLPYLISFLLGLMGYCKLLKNKMVVPNPKGPSKVPHVPSP